MKFLVAFDRSPEAEEALAYATDVADAMAASITVVHSVDPDVYEQDGSEPISGLSDADDQLIVENVEDAEERAMEFLNDAREFAEELGHEVETELLYGDPVTEVTDYADDDALRVTDLRSGRDLAVVVRRERLRVLEQLFISSARSYHSSEPIRGS